MTRPLVTLALALSLMAGAAAQTQTGIITGVVTDEQGGVMPGATPERWQ